MEVIHPTPQFALAVGLGVRAKRDVRDRAFQPLEFKLHFIIGL
jgi:hypothetical protein